MSKDDEGDLAPIPETMPPTMPGTLSSPAVCGVPSARFIFRAWSEPTLEFVLQVFFNMLYNILHSEVCVIPLFGLLFGFLCCPGCC